VLLNAQILAHKKTQLFSQNYHQKNKFFLYQYLSRLRVKISLFEAKYP